MNIYTYVIMTDRGSAPNYDPPFTTLAICKPVIRRGAQLGDVVLAFTGSTLSPEPHSVCWAGVVAEKLTLEEYWNDRRFEGKKPNSSSTPDNIYQPKDDGLLHVSNNSHGPGAFTRDTSGQYVLIFNPSWYFGSGGPLMPAEFGLRMTSGRRAHRKSEFLPNQWMELRTWLDNGERSYVSMGAISDSKTRRARSCD